MVFKPKRFDRARNWRVARRKKRKEAIIKGKGRNRKKRPKHKGRTQEKTIIENKEVKKE
jgi:hypothetical protein